MSATLGPIHHWLYNKINLQNKLSNSIIDKYKLLTHKIILPEITDIDSVNIHGWLQDKVNIVEQQFSDVIVEALKITSISELKEYFENVGKTYVDGKKTALEFYKQITDKLLDGMPCDHVNSIIENENKTLIYKKNICVHEKYWSNVENGGHTYYLLINSLISGMAEKASVIFEVKNNNVFLIKEI